MSDTLPSVTRKHAAARPDQPAIVFGDRSTSWGMLDVASSRVANGLLASGVELGGRVAVLARSNDRFFEIFFGTAKAGGVLVAVNWRLAAPEVEFILADAGATVLFVEDEFLPIVERLRERLPALREIVVDGGAYERWRDEHSDTDPFKDSNSAETVMQLYTSGTTGRPKGALISHQYFFNNLELVKQTPSGFIDQGPGDSTLLTFPLFHIGGINWAFMGAAQGATQIVMREFNPAEVLRYVTTFRIPALPLVGPMLQAVLAVPEAATADFSAVRHVVYGAAPMPPALLRTAIDVIGCDFVQTYGLTESTIVTVLDAEDHRDPQAPRMGSVGCPMAGVEIKIVDSDGNELPAGQTGEIIVRSPVMMSGYFNQPEASAETIVDGWLHTGDAAALDDEGFVFLKDRIKDTIVSGGENIYPAEIENALFEHPSVAEVAVVGVSDERWGEVPKAFIVLAPGARLDSETLLAHTRERIASYKLPKHFEAIASLPRTASGKVMRRELRV